ncbi:hypothetical protein RCL_jg25370.t1 [Rhizophagus clarus]|uniref:Uncharacterized protein n=1 Tax=Rhizophagus clarus TaxID=94130 RepID=A0A8H3L8E7_9GLOM|nr:hypothetical protein RCL_jg25370.t1 [Rhizophagus clarus]
MFFKLRGKEENSANATQKDDVIELYLCEKNQNSEHNSSEMMRLLKASRNIYAKNMNYHLLKKMERF